MSIEVELAQDNFLRQGGVFARALAAKYKSGELSREYVFHEYPKALLLDGGTTIVVNSAEEEDRILSGDGRTNADLEAERLDLQQKCRNLRMNFDPSWTVVRLRRELGLKLDEQAAPQTVDEEMAELEARVTRLQRLKEMRARIAVLEAEAAGEDISVPEPEVQAPGEDVLRTQLTALGVKVDGRWSVDRMRHELESALSHA